jgi:hypothetical protein
VSDIETQQSGAWTQNGLEIHKKISTLFDQRTTLLVGKFLVMIFLQPFRRQRKHDFHVLYLP